MENDLSFGQRSADQVAKVVGSWHFVIIQSIILAFWLTLNIIGLIKHWDPYPFVFLNLLLSFQAAYTAPIIMMSQNRQAEKDRQIFQDDFDVDKKTNAEIIEILDHLHKHEETLEALVKELHAKK